MYDMKMVFKFVLNQKYLLKICDSLPESMEVEIISNIVFIYFYEKLVAFKITEPLNPAGA